MKEQIKKDDKIAIGKVTVKMGDREVALTVDQARELCALLKGLFGEDTTKIVHVPYYRYPYPWYATVYSPVTNGISSTPVSTKAWEYSGLSWTADCDSSGNVSFSTVK